MVDSIAKTLGAGSGIDITALVTSLVEAQFEAQTARLTKRTEAIDAQISGIARLKSAITSFDTALKTLAGSGTLASKLVSSDESALRATIQPGADAGGVARAIGIAQLASAQVSTTDTAIPPATAFRTGTLTLRWGQDTVDANGAVTGFAANGSSVAIDITDGDATLAGIAAKINAANAGVTATVIADAGGARLSIKGGSGAAQAFEIDAVDGGGSGASLATLAVGGSSTTTSSGARARDAIVTVAGVRYTRTTNTIADLVPGVTLELLARSQSPVSIAMTRPAEALGNAVNDFVAAYNDMLALTKEESDPINGSLRGDAAVTAMARGLASLTTTNLTGGDGPATLADLGVATARDGTLSVNAAALSRALRDHPAAVEAMFQPGAGLSRALTAIATRVTSRNTGFDAATARYNRIKDDIAKAQLRVTDETEATRTRLTQQFASMDAKVAAYKSTQTFLTQQIDAWNSAD